MANKKLDELSNLPSIADADLLLVYDVDEGSSQKTKNMTYAQFHTLISGTVGGNESSNLISQGDSNVTVTDAGSGVITAVVDATEVVNITDTNMRLGVSGDTLFEMNQTGNNIGMSVGGVGAVFALTGTWQRFGPSNDVHMELDQTNNKILFDLTTVNEMTIDSGGMSLKDGADVNDITTAVVAPGDDDTLATEKAIVDYVNTVSGSLDSYNYISEPVDDLLLGDQAETDGAAIRIDSANGIASLTTSGTVRAAMVIDAETTKLNTYVSQVRHYGPAASSLFAMQIGENSVTRGQISINGAATGSVSGGVLFAMTAFDYSSPISYYSFKSYQDDLLIGPSNDTDSLQYNGGTGQWEFTGAAGVDVVNALTAGTVDADTDFTVGGTVITDGNITDTTPLALGDTSGSAAKVTIDPTTASVVVTSSGNDVTEFTSGNPRPIRIGKDGTNHRIEITNTGGIYLKDATETTKIFMNSSNLKLGEITDTHISVGSSEVQLFVNGTQAMNVDSGGMSLGTGTTPDVNEILDSTDAIDAASTDDQLTTAKLIYDHVNTVSGSVAGGSVAHNDTTGLQGGDTDEYYHLNAYEDTQISGTAADVITLGTHNTRVSIDGTTAQGQVIITSSGTEQAKFQGRDITFSAYAPYNDYAGELLIEGNDGLQYKQRRGGTTVRTLKADFDYAAMGPQTNYPSQLSVTGSISQQNLRYWAGTQVDGNLQMTIDNTGMTLLSGTNVNDVLDSADDLSTSTDNQLATAKLIYDHVNTVSGSLGSGAVVGPSSSTDNAIVRFDETTGELVQDSLVIVDDTGNVVVPDGKGILDAALNTSVVVNSGAATELHFSGVKTAATEVDGFSVFDRSGNDPILYLKDDANATVGYFQVADGIMYLSSSSKIHIKGNVDGSTELNHNGTKKFETTSSGIEVTGGIFVSDMKSGATQGGATAAVDELWRTASHATLPDGVVMIGI